MIGHGDSRLILSVLESWSGKLSGAGLALWRRWEVFKHTLYDFFHFLLILFRLSCQRITGVGTEDQLLRAAVEDIDHQSPHRRVLDFRRSRSHAAPATAPTPTSA